MGLKISNLEKLIFELIRQAVIYLPEDVKSSLKTAFASETSQIGKTQLESILKNVNLAEKNHRPICQDTGTLTFFLKVGDKFKELDEVEQSIFNATKFATEKIPLRPNAVNPFNQKNTGDNTGRFIPIIHWEIVSGENLEITVLAKGGGSENVSNLGMLSPAEGLVGMKKFVLNAIIEAGAKPCPPTVVGVGLGGGADQAMILAKKALLRPLDEKNFDPHVAQMEREILSAANMTGIGPMGLGGSNTVMAVHMEYAHRHPASFPVAVAFSCWALRRASARINSDGKILYLTHKPKVGDFNGCL